MKKSLFLAVSAALCMSMTSCDKDEKIIDDNSGKSMTQEEMYENLLSNDRLNDGFKGEVKSYTWSRSYTSQWANNTVRQGHVTSQTFAEYSKAGCMTKRTNSMSMAVSVKWDKNKQGGDILVITNGLKPYSGGNYTFDSKNRITESVFYNTYYTRKVGNYSVWSSDNAQDTILYETIKYSAQVGDPLVVKTDQTWTKRTFNYDDQAKTATVIEYGSGDGKTFEPVSKTVCKQDRYGRVYETTDSEVFHVKSAEFVDSPSSKTTVKYDNMTNVVEIYTLNLENQQPRVTVHNVWDFIYY